MVYVSSWDDFIEQGKQLFIQDRVKVRSEEETQRDRREESNIDSNQCNCNQYGDSIAFVDFNSSLAHSFLSLSLLHLLL